MVKKNCSTYIQFFFFYDIWQFFYYENNWRYSTDLKAVRGWLSSFIIDFHLSKSILTKFSVTRYKFLLFCCVAGKQNSWVSVSCLFFILTSVPAGYPSYSGSKTSLMYGASIDFGISGFGVPSLSDITDVTLSKRAFVYWWIFSCVWRIYGCDKIWTWIIICHRKNVYI